MTFLALVQLGALAFGAQNQIAGTVVDQNGKPVQNVVVSVSPGDLQIASDASGAFLVDYLRDEAGERVKLGRKTEYVFEFFKPGFHSQRMQVKFLKGAVVMDALALVPVTIDVVDLGGNLDPALYDAATSSEGATYEGQ